MKIIIIIILLLLILYVINQNNDSFINQNNNKWIVLLTACVNPNQQDNNNKDNIEVINYRKTLYTRIINRWLTYTNFPIYVVESSGYEFDDIKNDRLVVFSFNGEPKPNSSIAEAESIKYALEQLKNYDDNYTHILKVTCKYYLDGIQNLLETLPSNYDIYTQQHKNHDFGMQNTEYYGIKKDLYYDFVNTMGYNLMESHLYNFMKDKKTMDIPQYFSNDVPRNDGNILHPL